MSAPFMTPAQVRTFVLGGNSLFTIESVSTEVRFTYRAQVSEDEQRFYVSVLTGSDNETDYTFMGTIFADDPMTYRHSRKSRIGLEAKSTQAFDWFWRQVSQGRLPASVKVWHEGRCGRCGRTLTVPSSIESGFGPECVKHI